MKKWDTVAILGVGLIGGSIGLGLRQRGLARNVVGIGRRRSSLQAARQRGAVTTTTTNLARGVAEAQLVVVCTPVEKIVEHALAVAEHCPPRAIITDVGSTKAQIVARLDRAVNGAADHGAAYVGSHPLAGSEKTGVQHARPDLLEGHIVIITPSPRTPATASQAAARLWKGLGARVLRQTPQQHDQTVAAVSHLTHLVASALAAATPERDLPLVASGWLDTTRIAAADSELWRQILSDNRRHVLKSLDKFEKVLAAFRQALDKDDQKKLLQLLEAGKRHRESVGN